MDITAQKSSRNLISLLSPTKNHWLLGATNGNQGETGWLFICKRLKANHHGHNSSKIPHNSSKILISLLSPTQPMVARGNQEQTMMDI